MKSIFKLINLVILIALAIAFCLRDVLPVKAVAPYQAISILTHAPANAANGENFTVNATADSGLDVSYSAVGGCTNLGAVFTMTSDSETCIVQYDQAGGNGYDPAPQLTENVTAQPAATPTASTTATASPTWTMTETSTPTATPTQTATATSTATFTVTSTASTTPTATATAIPAFYVSTTGNDSNSCTTPAETCLTINGAILKATNGDIIKVATGTYTAASGYGVVMVNKSLTLLGGWDADFIAQTSTSTIDGELIRGGIYLTNSAPVKTITISRFTIMRGKSRAGGITNYENTVTVNDSFIINNVGSDYAGGIFTEGGSITINNSVVTGNMNTESGARGGGVFNYGGILTINHSTINGNTSTGDASGIFNTGVATVENSSISFNTGPIDYTEQSGIYNSGTLTLNNSTVHGNTNSGIVVNGNISLNNSTVSSNKVGINKCSWCTAGQVTIKNSIVANNNIKDCIGPLLSGGYNLIGNTSGCVFTRQVGDRTNINAMLGQSIGQPGYVPLLSNSPAINAGNPATCLATDQRGLTRPEGSTCDMGAYEYKLPGTAASFNTATGSNQAMAVKHTYLMPLTIYVVDNLGSPVTGVPVVFTAPASGASGTFAATSTNTTTVITDNRGLATTSAFTANQQWGSYLVSASAGGLPGSVNFSLTNQAIPTLLSPSGKISDMTPLYQWYTVLDATSYQYELSPYEYNTIVYTYTISASQCGPTICSSTPTTNLKMLRYRWRVRAMVNGIWQDFSPYKLFDLKPAAGFWSNGKGLEFYVSPNQMQVKKFTAYIHVVLCGNYKISTVKPVPITNMGHYAFQFYTNINTYGSFNTAKSASGFGNISVYIPGCGYVLKAIKWSMTWKNATQHATSFIEAEVTPMPANLWLTEMPDFGSYTVERINP